MRSKEKTLYWIWKKYSGGRWGEKLKEVGVVTQEDVNGFLRLVGEKDKRWRSGKIGYFVSKVLEICYEGRFIELDVGAVDGKICVGENLDWDGVIYVKGDVRGKVGWGMKNGFVVVKGDVGENVGTDMKGGVIVVDGNVNGFVGWGMEGGEIYIKGSVDDVVGFFMKGGVVIIASEIRGYVGHKMDGGNIYIKKSVKEKMWMELSGKGFVVNNGFVYLGRNAR